MTNTTRNAKKAAAPTLPVDAPTLPVDAPTLPVDAPTLPVDAPTLPAALPTDAPALQLMVSQLLAQLASKQAPTRTNALSAKQLIINALSVDDALMSIDELVAITGKNAVNIRTQLSDLKSVRYAGSYGVQPIKSAKRDGVTRYYFDK